MMRKVQIIDPGDTKFLENNSINKWEFIQRMIKLARKQLQVRISVLKAGQIVSARKPRDENSALKRMMPNRLNREMH